ncbi:MAG: hypothetical protein HY562_06370 [Ignavibacteriales bacterium]|nr:hypothetical protein [Ignavibacteriales bacterium]
MIYLFAAVPILGCGNREPSGAAEASNSHDSTAVAATNNFPKKPEPPKPVDEMNHEERNQYKGELSKSGVYDCCIKPTCNMCLYDEAGQCPCAELLKKGEGVCGECHKGWRKGKGAVKGIDPRAVKRM